MDKPDLEVVDLDPFDPARFRLDTGRVGLGAVKKLLTTIPVKRPPKTSFFRVHPGADYRLDAAFLKLEDDDETFLLDPVMVSECPEDWWTHHT